MTKKNELEFANFILRFGHERVLLDFVEEIVIPAFTGGQERIYREETRYFFHGVEIINFGDEESPIVGIIGRFIKDTVVRREQVFDDESNELLKDVAEMHTSPSAIFILILNNHRLIYFNETFYAPSLSMFQTTLSGFLRQKYQDFLDTLYQQSASNDITREELSNQYDPPSLQIVPLTREESIREFVNRYNMLKTVEIKLLATNNELDNNDFFRQVRESKEEAHSTSTSITHNNGKDGLSKGGIIRQLESALSQGNSKVKLSGKDSQGNILVGSNESFKLRSHLTDVSQSISGIASKSYEAFQNLASQGAIQVGEASEDISQRIIQIWNKIQRG